MPRCRGPTAGSRSESQVLFPTPAATGAALQQALLLADPDLLENVFDLGDDGQGMDVALIGRNTGDDFSFSGLKTAVVLHVQANPDSDVADVAASFQAAAVDQLVAKLERVADDAEALEVHALDQVRTLDVQPGDDPDMSHAAAPALCLLPDRVAQLPLAAFARPQVRRAEGVGQPHEVVAVHQRRFEHLRCLRELALRDGLAIWMSHGTHQAIGAPDLGDLLHIARDGEAAAAFRLDMPGCHHGVIFFVEIDDGDRPDGAIRQRALSVLIADRDLALPADGVADVFVRRRAQASESRVNTSGVSTSDRPRSRAAPWSWPSRRIVDADMCRTQVKQRRRLLRWTARRSNLSGSGRPAPIRVIPDERSGSLRS